MIHKVKHNSAMIAIDLANTCLIFIKHHQYPYQDELATTFDKFYQLSTSITLQTLNYP